MNAHRLACFALSVAVSMGMAPAPSNAQDIFAACSDAIANHCADVTPGHGRLYACLYAHEDKIGDGCDAAVADVHDLVDQLFELVRFAKQECRADIETHCGDVAMGGGRIYTCLKAQEAALSESCAQVMSQLETD